MKTMNRLRKLEGQHKAGEPLLIVVSDHEEADRKLAEFGPNRPENLTIFITGVPSPDEDDSEREAGDAGEAPAENRAAGETEG